MSAIHFQNPRKHKASIDSDHHVRLLNIASPPVTKRDTKLKIADVVIDVYVDRYNWQERLRMLTFMLGRQPFFGLEGRMVDVSSVIGAGTGPFNFGFVCCPKPFIVGAIVVVLFPKITRRIHIQTTSEIPFTIILYHRFRVYDIDTQFHGIEEKMLKLEEQQLLGEGTSLMCEIVTKQNRTLPIDLVRKGESGSSNRPMKLGQLTIHAEECVASKTTTELDSFLVISKRVQSVHVVPICKTEFVSVSGHSRSLSGSESTETQGGQMNHREREGRELHAKPVVMGTVTYRESVNNMVRQNFCR
ncbi:hypothetical protein L2E82_03073 [Cichorium intybus]|uniref:Uncharacterized protein n=1 Tax=Cichorium intybus TaxID=13427 RepID=A0ACB9H3E0_CICIN|nr:hypothetical protein L2E82_03073 [Cichorium intybus]